MEKTEEKNEEKKFEVKRILGKRKVPKGHGFQIQYLIRWKGYRPEFDT